MIVLDDVITVSHLIYCAGCGIFTNMKEWLEHKERTGHLKSCHSVAVVGEEFNRVHSFDPEGI